MTHLKVEISENITGEDSNSESMHATFLHFQMVLSIKITLLFYSDNVFGTLRKALTNTQGRLLLSPTVHVLLQVIIN